MKDVVGSPSNRSAKVATACLAAADIRGACTGRRFCLAVLAPSSRRMMSMPRRHGVHAQVIDIVERARRGSWTTAGGGSGTR